MDSLSEQESSILLDQGSQKEYGKCYLAACWIFQLLTWGCLATSLYFFLNQKKWAICIAVGVCYLVYIILEFCSPTAKYLCNKSSDQGTFEKMGRFFQACPVISFWCECYHYETTITYTTDSKGNTTKRESSPRKVVTHTDSYTFSYYSAKDVSGLFHLNCEKADIMKKHYIKLELVEEINFADTISRLDYETEKFSFMNRNRYRDTNFDFKEKSYIPGLKHHNLVKLDSKCNFMVNFFWFFLFTLLSVAEFYKIFLESICIFQRFKIRKLISTRYSLDDKFQALAPKIDLITQQYQYNKEYYNYQNDNYQVQPPTESELEEARQYQDKIPDYEKSSESLIQTNYDSTSNVNSERELRYIPPNV